MFCYFCSSLGKHARLFKYIFLRQYNDCLHIDAIDCVNTYFSVQARKKSEVKLTKVKVYKITIINIL